MNNTQRETIRRGIETENYTTKELLKEILTELRLFNLQVSLSQMEVRKQQEAAKLKLEEIKNKLPPEARTIFESLKLGAGI